MPKGSFLLEFDDVVDIMIGQDPDIENKLFGMADDIDDGVDGNPLTEAAEEEMEDDDDNDIDMVEIGVDTNIVSDDVPPVTSATSYDMEADTMIDAYYDISNGQSLDVGDMIDIVADMQ